MAFGAFNPHRPQAMMSDINVTPMVDVMLVLLVIFIVAAPMFTHAVALELPRAAAAPLAADMPGVTITLDAAGVLHWENEVVGAREFEARLAAAARRQPQPVLQLRADRHTRYEAVARVMAAAQRHGLHQLGFLTDPQQETPDGKR